MATHMTSRVTAGLVIVSSTGCGRSRVHQLTTATTNVVTSAAASTGVILASGCSCERLGDGRRGAREEEHDDEHPEALLRESATQRHPRGEPQEQRRHGAEPGDQLSLVDVATYGEDHQSDDAADEEDELDRRTELRRLEVARLEVEDERRSAGRDRTVEDTAQEPEDPIHRRSEVSEVETPEERGHGDDHGDAERDA